MAAVEFEGVSKRFGAVTVVENLSLRVEEGEFFTFVGPSGCGKSTLLSLIAGLERPTSGALRFDDRIVNDLPPRERDVAMVFQSYALYPHMTVAENIGFPLRLRRVPAGETAAAVARVAQSLELESLLHRRPRELSGGQRQRVALGRALIRRPRVFLMDEPLSNLDARLRLEMRAELKRLHAEYRITTVYVTHDQEEALALSDRVAVLHEGRLQQCGAPMQVYDDPANLFVAGFIGSPPINLFDVGLLDTALGGALPVSAHDAVAGIRPSDIRVSDARRDGAFEAQVILCEPTGGDVWVLGEWRGVKILGRGAGGPLAPGSRAYFEFPPERVHLFDRARGTRIISPRPVSPAGAAS